MESANHTFEHGVNGHTKDALSAYIETLSPAAVEKFLRLLIDDDKSLNPNLAREMQGTPRENFRSVCKTYIGYPLPTDEATQEMIFSALYDPRLRAHHMELLHIRMNGKDGTSRIATIPDSPKTASITKEKPKRQFEKIRPPLPVSDGQEDIRTLVQKILDKIPPQKEWVRRILNETQRAAAVWKLRNLTDPNEESEFRNNFPKHELTQWIGEFESKDTPFLEQQIRAKVPVSSASPKPPEEPRLEHPVKHIPRIQMENALRQKIAPSILTEAQAAKARSFGIEMVGDPKMEQAFKNMLRYAAGPLTMLIRGEAGTGKEPLAQAVLRHRKERGISTNDKMVVVNCAAVTDTLFESELFGHVKNSFSGAASSDRTGKYEAARDGVLFLDEIGDMPLHQQTKLLRLLESQSVTPVGSNETKIINNVKVVCATNRPLEELVEQGKFRGDLWGRISATQIQLPRWDDRAEPHRLEVIRYIESDISKRYPSLPPLELSDDAVMALLAKSFPRNVRQLKHTIERAYNYASADQEESNKIVVTGKELNETREPDPPESTTEMRHIGSTTMFGPLEKKGGGYSMKAEFFFSEEGKHKGAITDVFAAAGYQLWLTVNKHVGKAAKIMGISRRTMTEYIRDYRQKMGITAPKNENLEELEDDEEEPPVTEVTSDS